MKSYESESTRYSALPLPPRIMRQTHTQHDRRTPRHNIFSAHYATVKVISIKLSIKQPKQ